jgi:hypothetical protein
MMSFERRPDRWQPGGRGMVVLRSPGYPGWQRHCHSRRPVRQPASLPERGVSERGGESGTAASQLVGVFSVPPVELAWAVELVNEFSDPTRAAAGELDEPYPELSAPDGHFAGQPWETAELVRAANELHAVFDAAERGASVDGAINGILDRARPWQRASPTGIGFAVTDVHNVLPAACALALLEWIAAHGTRRIGMCDAGRCVDVFADASAAGHRRFCSAICSNRHRVAQYRARQREQTRGPRRCPGRLPLSALPPALERLHLGQRRHPRHYAPLA